MIDKIESLLFNYYNRFFFYFSTNIKYYSFKNIQFTHDCNPLDLRSFPSICKNTGLILFKFVHQFSLLKKQKKTYKSLEIILLQVLGLQVRF